MYAHIKVPIDKSGRVARLARRKARIPRAKVRAYTAAQLDAYINDVLRSVKNFRNGQPFAGHLEATRSVPHLLETLFGSEGRWAPYARYLEWELRKFPLRSSPLPTSRFLTMIRGILRDGDVPSQRAVFVAVERSFRGRGYGRVFDDWEPSQLELVRGGESKQHSGGP